MAAVGENRCADFKFPRKQLRAPFRQPSEPEVKRKELRRKEKENILPPNRQRLMLSSPNWRNFDLRGLGAVRLHPFAERHLHENSLQPFTRSVFPHHVPVGDVASAMNFLHLVLVWMVSLTVSSKAQNLSCYQCVKNSNEECGPENLQPCPRVADRCVTHISRQADKGFLIKRECGLGPCGFEDDMVNKGLGMSGCDRSKDEYFCVFCCGTDGCNKNGSSRRISIKGVLATLIFLFFKKALI